jgi:hypothetical protein
VRNCTEVLLQRILREAETAVWMTNNWKIKVKELSHLKNKLVHNKIFFLKS